MRIDIYKFNCTCGNSGTIKSERKISGVVQCSACGKNVSLTREGHVSGMTKMEPDFFGTLIDKSIWAGNNNVLAEA